MWGAKQHPIRVGMISMHDLNCPNYLSGMPYQMAKALRGQGIEIIPIPVFERARKSPSLPSRIINRLRRILHNHTPTQFGKSLDYWLPLRTQSAVFKHARMLSQYAQKNLDDLLQQGQQIDAIFGCCISTAMYELHTEIPLIYFSDATSLLLRATYHMYTTSGSSFHEALTEVEKASVARANLAIFATPNTQQSAIHDLDIDPRKTSMVVMGANVYPNDPASIMAPAQPPTREKCDLLIVAADPIRKQVDLATQITGLLRQRGTNAVLHVIGPGTRKSNHSDAVNAIGPLSLSNPDDRTKHQHLLRKCHLQLLPSLGEACGIAPSESAHFARPSIVSSAGGLPFVVRNGQTGMVIDINSNAQTWAMAVESLIDNPDRYRKMSRKALIRARKYFNWSAWGATVTTLILEQILAKQTKIHHKNSRITRYRLTLAETHHPDKAPRISQSMSHSPTLNQISTIE